MCGYTTIAMRERRFQRFPLRRLLIGLAEKSQGMKQLMAGGGVALIGTTLVPLLSGLFG